MAHDDSKGVSQVREWLDAMGQEKRHQLEAWGIDNFDTFKAIAAQYPTRNELDQHCKGHIGALGKLVTKLRLIWSQIGIIYIFDCSLSNDYRKNFNGSRKK